MISRATSMFILFAFARVVASCGSPHVAASQASQTFATKENFESSDAVSSGAPPAFSEARFDFGEVFSGSVVDHDFALTNRGSTPLLIEKVQMTPPLLVTQMPRDVGPGAQGRIHFRLDTANLEGKFEGAILVVLRDPGLSQARLEFAGHVIAPIELLPRAAFFVAGQRGQANQANIEIVNHESSALTITNIEHPPGRFTTQLETLESGQRFRLTLTLKPDGPGGRASNPILIRTSSKRTPELQVTANTYLYDRVHAFPEIVDFGTWRAGEDSETSAIVMIHQEGGSNFKVQLSTDVPGINLNSERAPKGDRYQVEVALNLYKIPVGPIQGSIFVDTNDPQFPRVIVPVHGQVVPR